MNTNSLEESCSGDPMLDDHQSQKESHSRGSSSSMSASRSSINTSCSTNDLGNNHEYTQDQIDLALNSNFDPSFFEYEAWQVDNTTLRRNNSNNNGVESSPDEMKVPGGGGCGTNNHNSNESTVVVAAHNLYHDDNHEANSILYEQDDSNVPSLQGGNSNRSSPGLVESRRNSLGLETSEEANLLHLTSFLLANGGSTTSIAQDTRPEEESGETLLDTTSHTIASGRTAKRSNTMNATDSNNTNDQADISIHTDTNFLSSGQASLHSPEAIVVQQHQHGNINNEKSSASTDMKSSYNSTTGNNNSNNITSQNHPQAIQSSACCPPTQQATQQSINPAINAQQAAAVAAAHAVAAQAQSGNLPDGAAMMNPALLPLTFNAIAAGANLNHTMAALFLHQQQQMQQQQSQQQQPQQFCASPVASMNNNGNHAVAMAQGRTLQHQHGVSTSSSSRRQAKPPPNRVARQQQNTSSNSMPPFLLFDAPIELRSNFMAAQRALGIPPMEDNNSVHYTMAVNGFHPQQQQQQQAERSSNVRLIDGRHGDVGNKRLRNVREQKRTQKIADLIDQLRLKMERGGWRVGLKSKFHTLSSCAEYVRHLVQVNKDKEAALDKAKKDLEAKRRKLEEDKQAQQDPSDPESTTSSLTVSSGSANAKTETQKISVMSNSDQSAQKRKAESSGDSETNIEEEKVVKKSRLASHGSTVSSVASSGGDDSGKQEVGQSVSVNQMTSSVSDITDSNKGSSDGISGIPKSVSSDAAVARATTADGNTNYSDVVFKGKKRKAISQASQTELDYRIVFQKSNVPQVLATTSGRIVAWNEIFLKATGLSEEVVERLTIFSLVRSNKLSNLFEIVAAALRSDDSKRGNEQASDPDKVTGQDGEHSNQKCKWNYNAITLPCTTFQPQTNNRKTTGDNCIEEKPLYITVTLMTDKDPRKRCFHCVFTDFPASNGALGRVTPELLSRLFARNKKTERDEQPKKCENLTAEKCKGTKE